MIKNRVANPNSEIIDKTEVANPIATATTRTRVYGFDLDLARDLSTGLNEPDVKINWRREYLRFVLYCFPKIVGIRITDGNDQTKAPKLPSR